MSEQPLSELARICMLEFQRVAGGRDTLYTHIYSTYVIVCDRSDVRKYSLLGLS